MATRLQIIKLKPNATVPPNVLGWSATLTVPDEIPNLYELQRNLRFIHDNAPLLVELLGAATTLFPSRKKHVSPKGPTPPTPA